MLAVNSKDYYAPVKCDHDGRVAWRLDRKSGEGMDTQFVEKFHYTLTFKDPDGNPVNHFTLNYDGASVKPAPRSLRVFGADICQKVVSEFSSNIKIRHSIRLSAPRSVVMGEK